MAEISRLIVAALFAAVLAPVATPAQLLQRLHVRSFAISADRSFARVSDTVHVSITLHTDEAIDSCDAVTLPDFFGFEVLGDERVRQSSPRGTDCTERITLQATTPGLHRIGPATLDAIDATTGRPSRFGTNTIEIRVGAAVPDYGVWIRELVISFGSVLALAVALFLLVRYRLSRFGAVTRIEPEPELPQPAVQPESDASRWRTLIATLAQHPTRGNVIGVRTLLRERIGARDEETFGDLLARGAMREQPDLLDAMRAIERATFIDDSNLTAAVRDSIAPLDRFVRTMSS